MKYLILILCFTNVIAAKGPPNDNFDNATKLTGSFPIKGKGALTDGLDRFRATKEEGEPNHAGQEGHGSVWFTWTPNNSDHVRINLRSKKIEMKLILAVYIGQSANDLALVHRYEGFAFPAFSRIVNEPFTDSAYVEFDAIAGKTYHIAVDTENEVYDRFNFQIQKYPNLFKPSIEVMKPGSRWEYLLATNKEGEPVDPKKLDVDFYHTWMFPKRYDGPEFLKGNMPIGYGRLDFGKLRSNLGGRRHYVPTENNRFTAYLRNEFTPVLDITALGIEGVFDDGAIFYLNGKERLRFHLPPQKNPQNWKTLANVDKNDIWGRNERIIRRKIIKGLNLPADVPVNVSLSLHNSGGNDDDLGTDLRIYALSSATIIQ